MAAPLSISPFYGSFSFSRKAMGALVVLLLLVTATEAQTKRALLIGIGTYPDVRWKPLSSANDLAYLKTALQLQGFQPANMLVLADSAATYKGIDNGFEQLKKQCKPGDIVYVHFSGHGQQIEDDEENPDETDGFDEALVPYDARGKYDPVKYYGQHHYRDDALGRQLEGIRAVLGSNGSLLVVIDACHSGTATRSGSIAITRGDPTPFASPEYKPKLKTTLGGRMAGEAFMSAAPLNTANMVVLSASSPNQVNYETHDDKGQGIGSLSYAVARALQQLPRSATYQQLFASVKSMIQAEYQQQLPMMEGDGTQQVFAGSYQPQSKQMQIDRWTSDSTFIIQQGQLQGIYAGTLVAVKRAGSNAALTTAVVTESNAVSAVLSPKQRLDKATPYSIEVLSYGTAAVQLNLSIDVAKNVPKATADAVQSWLKKQPAVRVSANGDYLLQLSQTTGGTYMELIEKGDITQYSTTLATGKTFDATLQQQWQQALKASARTRYLRQLNDGGPMAEKVVIQITAEGLKDASNEWKLTPGTEYKVSITNNSDTRLYFNLLNVLPNAKSQVLLPQPDEQPQDYSIGPGQTFDIDGIAVDETAVEGREYLRVVLSIRPLDLRPVFDSSPDESRKRNIGGAFEQWLNESLQNTSAVKTRSGNDEVTIVSTGFQVVKK